MIATSARTSVRLSPCSSESLPDCIQFHGQPAKEESDLPTRRHLRPPPPPPSVRAILSTIEIFDHQGKSCLAARIARWLVPAIIALAWLGLAGPLGALGGQLSTVQENDSAAFLPDSAESTRVTELLEGFRTAEPCR